MRPITLVSSLGGLVLLSLAGCGDDRSAKRDEGWREWPTATPTADQSAGSGAGVTSGSAAGYQPSVGPVDTGSIPATSPQPGGDVRSGDRRDYRWDTSSETTPIGSSPGISGANYAGSTVIPDRSGSFSPVIVGGDDGGRGVAAGTQPGSTGATGLPTSPRQSGAVPTGDFGLSPTERPNTGGGGIVNSSIGSGTTVITNPLEANGTGIDVTSGTGTTLGRSPLNDTTGGITPGTGSTGVGVPASTSNQGTVSSGGVTTTPGSGTSTGTIGGITTGAPGAGTGTVANPLERTPEQGAITNPGTATTGTDPTATGAVANPGTAGAAGSGTQSSGTGAGAGSSTGGTGAGAGGSGASSGGGAGGG